MTLSAAGRRRKGATWAAKVAAWLDDHGVDHTRDHIGKSESDFITTWLVSIEAKNRKAPRLAEDLDQAIRDAAAHGNLGVLLHHRPGVGSVDGAYVTMRADQWLELYAWASRPR